MGKKKKKKEKNGKQRKMKKAETWMKMALYREEILQTPYKIVKEMSERESELR